MPLIFVQRWVAPTAQFIEGGTQYLENGAQLSFAPGSTIALSNGVFGETGNYILFDYSAGSFPTPSQLSNVTVDTSGLALSGDYTLTNDPDNYRVVLSLKSRPDNGTQYVEGDLNITAPITMMLRADLYATPGDYVLFDVTGTIAAGSETKIQCVSLKGLSAGAPSISGNQIKVTLA